MIRPSGYGMVTIKIWYATPQNLVYRTSRFGLPHLKICYDEYHNLVWYVPQDMVCYPSKFGMINIKIRLVLLSKFGMPPLEIWYATPQYLV